MITEQKSTEIKSVELISCVKKQAEIYIISELKKIPDIISDVVRRGIPQDNIIQVILNDVSNGTHGYNPFGMKNGDQIADICKPLISNQEHINTICFIVRRISNAIITLNGTITTKDLAKHLVDQAEFESLATQLLERFSTHTSTLELNELIQKYSENDQFLLENIRHDLLGLSGVLYRVAFSYVGEIFDYNKIACISEAIHEHKTIIFYVPNAVKQSNYHTLNCLLQADLIHSVVKAKRMGLSCNLMFIKEKNKNKVI